MAIYHIDLENGNDANNGLSWGTAWKTITNGATAARVTSGDTVKISKSSDPVSIGNALWVDCPINGFPSPTSFNISSTTNTSPISVQITSDQPLVTGDIVVITGHNTNYTANGVWRITITGYRTFTLDNSVGVAVGGATGNGRMVTSKAIVLDTEQTQKIGHIAGGWIGVNDTTVSYATTLQKSGGNSLLCQLDATPRVSLLQAYSTIPLTNFSSKQKISFWMYNSVQVNLNNFYIALCSDTAGAVFVDKFKIPPTLSSNRPVNISIIRDGGGNLGSAIQSIALYTDTVQPSNSIGVRFDNFIASTLNGLSLDTLITKDGSQFGTGVDGFYGIQAINGKVVVLDNDTTTNSISGKGYASATGGTENVPTYVRGVFKTTTVSSVSTAVSTLNSNGTAYEFGYNVGTDIQDGLTILDGSNSLGYGLYSTNKTYYSMNNVCTCRYGYGMYMTGGGNSLFKNIPNTSNNANYGIWVSSCNNNVFENIGNLVNNNNNGLYLLNSYGNKIALKNAMGNLGNGINIQGSHFNKISSVLKVRNNNSQGVAFTQSNENEIENIVEISSNSSNALFFSGSAYNKVSNYLSFGNTSPSIYADCSNYIRNAEIQDASEVSQINGITWIYDNDKIPNNNWGFFNGGSFNIQSAVVHDTEPVAWKTTVGSSLRNVDRKIVFPLVEISGVQSTNLTVKAWVKKDHATNVQSRLVCYSDVALNIAEVSATKSDDTNWEQLTIVLNSSHPFPVFKIYLESWYSGGFSNTYVGKIVIL